MQISSKVLLLSLPLNSHKIQVHNCVIIEDFRFVLTLFPARWAKFTCFHNSKEPKIITAEAVNELNWKRCCLHRTLFILLAYLCIWWTTVLIIHLKTIVVKHFIVQQLQCDLEFHLTILFIISVKFSNTFLQTQVLWRFAHKV